MQKTINILFKVLRKIFLLLIMPVNNLACRSLFYLHNIEFDDLKSIGLPYISIGKTGKCRIKTGFSMNNTISSNPIGGASKCIIFVDNNASLLIGKNVGISGCAIVAHKNIIIGNNVKIGGGVCIYDTDFHSINFLNRRDIKLDYDNTKSIAVQIQDDVFIGAHSTILKGVVIGKNSVIGACSVVTNNIPENEIWAGNPAKFIKRNNANS